jgi:hypothetical protein
LRGGSKEKRKPPDKPNRKNKEKTCSRKLHRKRIAPEKKGKTHLTSKKKNRGGQLPWGRSYNVAPITFWRRHNHCSPTLLLGKVPCNVA